MMVTTMIVIVNLLAVIIMVVTSGVSITVSIVSTVTDITATTKDEDMLVPTMSRLAIMAMDMVSIPVPICPACMPHPL